MLLRCVVSVSTLSKTLTNFLGAGPFSLPFLDPKDILLVGPVQGADQ